jgi:UDP-2,3-diacylglucosamine diphosphatase
VRQLQAAAQRTALYFMHGNRDFLAGGAFLQHCGITGLQDPTVLSFAGQRYLLSHGDLLCVDDVDYQRFRVQARSPAWQQQFLSQPLATRRAQARGIRQESEARKQSGAVYADVDHPAPSPGCRPQARTHLIHGHTHRPADHALAPGLQRVVLSDWDAAALPPRLETLRLSATGLGTRGPGPHVAGVLNSGACPRQAPIQPTMPPFLNRLWRSVRATVAPVPDISAELWLQTLQRYPFLARLSLPEQAKLRALSALFLDQKQFHGAHGLEVTDAMAIDIAAQACLPLLHLGDAAKALDWYDDFVTIVVHPGEAVARRQMVDEAGVVHEHTEVLLGEAMERGPVMLSWQHIANAHENTARGHNVVVHEFVHKLDMRSGNANGCPPLPAGFMGARTGRAGA